MLYLHHDRATLLIDETVMMRHKMASWQAVEALAQRMKKQHMRDFWKEENRILHFTKYFGQLILDFSKQKLQEDEFNALCALAEDCQLSQAISDLMQGQPLNNTEGRAALHTALRAEQGSKVLVDGRNIIPAIQASLEKMRSIVERIHRRQWRGFSGEAITDIVNIGVGGSDLGPFMVCSALNEFTHPDAKKLNLHFASSIDGTQIADLLKSLNRETTLFIISSKSFTTLDTLSNAKTALAWMDASGEDRQTIVNQHFIGVSAKSDKMREFGIPESNQLDFWDWVGGRFSVWSGIGLPIALQLGMDGFEEFLKGAREMDTHFATTPFKDNFPVIMGLLGVWNATFLDVRGHAILPYDGRLKLFPSYLTQLEMESNGKSVTREGDKVEYATCPVLWGEVGSNAQHAFYQLLHQGTQAVSSDFIVPIKRYHQGFENPGLHYQHQLNIANCLAQSRVLMLGDACVKEGESAPTYRRYAGNQSSTTILLDSLNPYTLGALIALYEHKVFVMSVIWNINPFDQWGVELGKKIADELFQSLQHAHTDNYDGSTMFLLKTIHQGIFSS